MNLVNVLLLSALVAVPTLFGVMRATQEMGLAIAAIGLALVFANLNKFVRFKGAGFEAELQSAVDKTYAAIEQLKELALALSAPIVDELAVSGRMLQYVPLAHKLDRVEKIESALRELGATEVEITEACATLKQRVREDHFRDVLRALREANKDKQSMLKNLDEWDLTEWEKETAETFIRENHLEAPEAVLECLRDLEFFDAKGRLRREDRWQS